VIALREFKPRAELIYKTQLVEAVHKVLRRNLNFLPFTVRQLHYQILYLNPLPRLNDNKVETYKNDKASYRCLVDVVARLRVQGRLSWDTIHDTTRPRIRHHAARLAEVAAQYLKKGRSVFIEGRLQLDTWDDKQTGQVAGG
jgi:hypothetical protein